MSGTPWKDIRHKNPKPPGKKVITYQEFVIFDRWKIAFAWLHSNKKPLWKRLTLYWGKVEPDGPMP